MKEISIYQYYVFGYNYNEFRDDCKGKTVKAVIADLHDQRR